MSEMATQIMIQRELRKHRLELGEWHIARLIEMGFTERAVAELFKAQKEDLSGKSPPVGSSAEEKKGIQLLRDGCLALGLDANAVVEELLERRQRQLDEQTGEDDETELSKTGGDPIHSAASRQVKRWSKAGEKPLQKARNISETWRRGNIQSRPQGIMRKSIAEEQREHDEQLRRGHASDVVKAGRRTAERFKRGT